MRITRRPNRFTMSVTDHEYDILCAALRAWRPAFATSGHKRSWARRTGGGEFMRIDRDMRYGDE